MYKVVVFIPLKHKEKVKEALFKAGAGKQGNYEYCAFELEGLGQFKPLEGSDAFIGEVEKLEFVEEVRVELLVASDKIQDVIKALKEAHPYEEPAYDVFKRENF